MTTQTVRPRHAGYTGSCAEKGDYVVIQGEPLVSYRDACAIARQLMDDDEWGPAGAIRFGDPGVFLPAGSDQSWLFFGWASS